MTAGAGLVLVPRHRRLVLPIAAAPAALLLLAPGLGWAEGTVWTAESAYNLVRVVQLGGQRMLQLNHPSSIHTVREGSGGWTGFYYDSFALGPLLVPARRALVLGMGAGASIQAMRLTAPQIEIDAVEIDPRVVEAASHWFDVDIVADPRLRVHVMDARRFLARDRGTYELVQFDVYQGGPYVPFQLVTEECFRLARARMADDALLMMNVYDRSADSAVLSPAGGHAAPRLPIRDGQPDRRWELHAVRVHARAVRGQLAPVAGPPVERQRAEIEDPGDAGGRRRAGVRRRPRAPIEEMTRRMLAER